MEPTSAEQWAEWAAGFCEGEVKFCKGSDGWPELLFAPDRHFNPLEDLNHPGLVLDEIERRGLFWLMGKQNTIQYSIMIFSASQGADKVKSSGVAPTTRNLAVLRAAFALEEEKS